MSIATDNASVNNVLVVNFIRTFLSLYNILYHPNNHIHCINHVINMVVQAMLLSLGKADNPNDGKEANNFQQTKLLPLYYTAKSNPDQTSLEALQDEDLINMTPEDLLKKLELDKAAGFDLRSVIQKICAWK